jgi:prevent-host-death family protein
MKSVTIREAKAHLSALVADAAKGKAFVITKAGKALVKVVPFEEPSRSQARRLGFMAGRLKVPADFDRMGEKEIASWASDRRPSD